MYDNSLICFVSDHGDMLGDHHLWRKTYAYEGSSAIPYIVKLPKNMPTVLPAGSESDAPVGLQDLLPTFLTVNGQKVPDAIDGMSLQQLWSGESGTWRKYIAMEHNTAYFPENYWCALTDGKIKYVWFFHTGQEQLFDLTKDPQELRDLSTVSRYRKQLAAMRQEMVSYLSERGEEWVKDGQLVVRKKNLLYSPNYPKNKQK